MGQSSGLSVQRAAGRCKAEGKRCDPARSGRRRAAGVRPLQRARAARFFRASWVATRKTSVPGKRTGRFFYSEEIFSRQFDSVELSLEMIFHSLDVRRQGREQDKTPHSTLIESAAELPNHFIFERTCLHDRH